MKKHIVLILLVFSLCLLVGCSILTYYLEQSVLHSGKQNTNVLLNEIEQLTRDENGQNPAAFQIKTLSKQLHDIEQYQNPDMIRKIGLAYSILAFSLMAALLIYLYYKILRPFHKLQKYADQIARGDLDVSLGYERMHFFGSFTWAYDHMREEIITSKKMRSRQLRRIRQL